MTGYGSIARFSARRGDEIPQFYVCCEMDDQVQCTSDAQMNLTEVAGIYQSLFEKAWMFDPQDFDHPPDSVEAELAEVHSNLNQLECDLDLATYKLWCIASADTIVRHEVAQSYKLDYTPDDFSRYVRTLYRMAHEGADLI